MFKANKGFVTDPIRIKVGFEILKVEEHYQAGQASLDDVKDEIMEKLYTPRMQPELRKYLTKLREEAFIQIRGGYVDSGAAPGKDTTWKDPATLKPETTTKEEVAAHTKKKKHVLGVAVPFSGKTDPERPRPATPAGCSDTAGRCCRRRRPLRRLLLRRPRPLPTRPRRPLPPPAAPPFKWIDSQTRNYRAATVKARSGSP